MRPPAEHPQSRKRFNNRNMGARACLGANNHASKIKLKRQSAEPAASARSNAWPGSVAHPKNAQPSGSHSPICPAQKVSTPALRN